MRSSVRRRLTKQGVGPTLAACQDPTRLWLRFPEAMTPENIKHTHTHTHTAVILQFTDVSLFFCRALTRDLCVPSFEQENNSQ